MLAIPRASPADRPSPDTFPKLAGTSDWEVVRKTANFQSNGPVTNVNSDAIRCYQAGAGGSTGVFKAKAGGSISWSANPNIYHPGALSAYMAKVPAGQSASSWDGSGSVWFKVFQDMPSIAGGQMTWPSLSMLSHFLPLPPERTVTGS